MSVVFGQTDVTSRDFYSELGVARTGEPREIARGYRELAVRFHPDRRENNNSNDAFVKFQEGSEAYFYLSDPGSKSVYDRYGYYGLKKGLLGAQGQSAREYHNDPFRVCHEFFGGDQPFKALWEEAKGDNRRKSSIGNEDKAAPHHSTVAVTLEELMSGCEKQYRMTRKLVGASKTETRLFRVRIAAGTPTGTCYRFSGQGHEETGKSAGDVCLYLVEKPHPVFERIGKDLHLHINVSLLLAFSGFAISLPTLDGRQLSVNVINLVKPGSTKTIKGEGLPASGNGAKGDMIINFSIRWPNSVNADELSHIKSALKNSHNKWIEKMELPPSVVVQDLPR